MKKLKSLILVALFVFLALKGLKYASNPIQIVSTPYVIKATYNTEELQDAQNSDVLIVGDRLAEGLAPYLPELVKESSKKFQNPFEIYNWAKEKEGLHRTIHKLKSLKKPPRVVIYMGSTEEFYEKRFDLKHIKEINENFNRYHDETFISLILSFPFLSKFIYKAYPRVRLGPTITPRRPVKDHLLVQKILETTYQLFGHEYLELLDWAREHNISLIVVPPPHNLDTLPKQVCHASTSKEVELTQEKIRTKMENERFKESIEDLQALGQKKKGNALTFYYLGQSLKELGLFKDAKSILYRAQSYDCELWRGNMIFNRMIVTKAEQREFKVIDFNRIVNGQFGKNTLFFDDIYPQNIFYRKLVKELSFEIQKFYE